MRAVCPCRAKHNQATGAFWLKWRQSRALHKQGAAGSQKSQLLMFDGGAKALCTKLIFHERSINEHRVESCVVSNTKNARLP